MIGECVKGLRIEVEGKVLREAFVRLVIRRSAPCWTFHLEAELDGMGGWLWCQVFKADLGDYWRDSRNTKLLR